MIKNILVSLLVVFSLITIGAGCSQKESTITDSNLSFSERNNEIAVSAVIGPGVKILTTKTGSTTTVETDEYGTAMREYGKNGGNRLQILKCYGQPGFMTFKVGTKFMIDNRDEQVHNIKIDTKTYKLGPYDFAIVSINKVGDFNITCDGGNSARIVTQQ